MLIDEIKVAKWFRVKSPSFARCKEGELPLLNFSNLTCMYRVHKVHGRTDRRTEPRTHRTTAALLYPHRNALRRDNKT